MSLHVDTLLPYFVYFSAHGTFVGTLRLEIKKPTQLPLDTTIRFGASTRSYTLRERPQVTLNMATDSEGAMLEEGEGGTLLGLQDLDNEIDVSDSQVSYYTRIGKQSRLNSNINEL